jgi:hypothetical protein
MEGAHLRGLETEQVDRGRLLRGHYRFSKTLQVAIAARCSALAAGSGVIEGWCVGDKKRRALTSSVADSDMMSPGAYPLVRTGGT